MRFLQARPACGAKRLGNELQLNGLCSRQATLESTAGSGKRERR
jgi:hypothetical protein